jgi:hypothetical protein
MLSTAHSLLKTNSEIQIPLHLSVAEQETGQVHLRRPSVRSMCVHWVLAACSGNVSRSVCVCVRAWSARVGARRCVTYRSLSCYCADEYDVAEN